MLVDPKYLQKSFIGEGFEAKMAEDERGYWDKQFISKADFSTSLRYTRNDKLFVLSSHPMLSFRPSQLYRRVEESAVPTNIPMKSNLQPNHPKLD
jgi:hypothetical protein